MPWKQEGRLHSSASASFQQTTWNGHLERSDLAAQSCFLRTPDNKQHSCITCKALKSSWKKKNALPREQSAANPQEENSLLRGRWLWHQGSPAGTTQRCSVLEGELSCIFSYRRITKRGSVVLWFCFQHKYLHFLLTQEFTAGCSTTQVRNLFLQMLEQLMNLQALVMLNAICRAWNPDRPQSLLFIFRFSFIYDALKQNKKTEHSTATPYC